MNIKNWSKFQHFKDRKPPWIKLYRELMDDIEWFLLSPESAKLLIMLWLLASENNGYLPDIKTISFRTRMTIKDVEASMVNLGHWVEGLEVKSQPLQQHACDDITMISPRYQVDSLERERETETYKEETETETEEAGQNTCDVPLKRSRPARRKKEILSDDDWLRSLKETEAYEHINISAEYSKMLVWCQNKKKQPTRTRFINWLNRIEKPMKAIGSVIPIGFASRGVTGSLERAAALRQKAMEDSKNEI